MFTKEVLERIVSSAEACTVVFALVSAICGITYLMANRPLRKIEAQEMETERQKTAKAQEDAAKAQLELRKYIDGVAKRAGPRMLDVPRFMLELKGQPRGKVEIFFKDADSEASLFAGQIRRWLGQGENGDGAGWDVSRPRPFKPTVGLAGSGSSTGITVEAPAGSENVPGKPLWCLTNAIIMGLNRGNDSFAIEFRADLPEDTFVLLIGQRP
ncbi:MAG TPA: hypothetical protein VGZ48_15740 [Candidatus Acidoferrales bacterium]|jgi:hypothetical protein|nr:hypothetical protein [Candidatus Acidoferrales bacterium]